jgi:hypothetical protein
MATTFGSNIGSASKGAYAILPVNTTGAASFDIIDADVVTGAVVASPNNLTLTANQEAALSAIFAKVIAGVPAGAVTGNELAFIQKLVGVLSLVNGATVTLAVTNTAGNVWRLSADVSAAGEYFVYVPNSAAEGLFTGQGSSGDSNLPLIPYDIFLPIDQTLTPPLANQVLGSLTVGRSITFQSGKASGGVVVRCIVAPTAGYTVDVQKNGAPFGSATIAAGQTTAGAFTWAVAAASRVAAPGDIISFHGAAVVDATVAGIFATMLAVVNPPA